MNTEQAREEIPDIETFCRLCCDRCTGNDNYCPSYCNMLVKAQKLDFERIVASYARNDGDLRKVARYIKQTPYLPQERRLLK